MAVVLHHSRASGTAKVVLLGIANHDGDGGAWPSVDTLAKYANVSRRNVQNALRRLEELHEIRVIRNGGSNHSVADTHRPNLYHVTVRCPPTCDRTTGHRTSREVQFDLLSTGVSESTPGVATDAPGVSESTPEPPLNQINHLNKTGYGTRACEKSPHGEHDGEPDGWCVWGDHRMPTEVDA